MPCVVFILKCMLLLDYSCLSIILGLQKIPFRNMTATEYRVIFFVSHFVIILSKDVQ